jgi:hypothetical protein
MIRLAENNETARLDNQALGFVNEMVKWSNQLEKATSQKSKANCLEKIAKYRNKAIEALENAKNAARPRT